MKNEKGLLEQLQESIEKQRVSIIRLCHGSLKGHTFEHVYGNPYEYFDWTGGKPPKQYCHNQCTTCLGFKCEIKHMVEDGKLK